MQKSNKATKIVALLLFMGLVGRRWTRIISILTDGLFFASHNSLPWRIHTNVCGKKRGGAVWLSIWVG